MKPGEYLLASDPIELNAGRETRKMEVSNRGDRPIQVGSDRKSTRLNSSH